VKGFWNDRFLYLELCNECAKNSTPKKLCAKSRHDKELGKKAEKQEGIFCPEAGQISEAGEN